MRPSAAVLILFAIFLAGCASVGPGVHAGDPYMVNTQRTLFYSYGPAQASGPDFALDHGARVTMLSYDYGYSHVAVVGTGQSGYVATEDLIPALPLPKSSPAPATPITITETISTPIPLPSPIPKARSRSPSSPTPSPRPTPLDFATKLPSVPRAT